MKNTLKLFKTEIPIVAFFLILGSLFVLISCGKTEEAVEREVVRPVKTLILESAGSGVVRQYPSIEDSAGRRRTGPTASRTLDLDLLLLGDLEFRDDRLQLPHPRIWERSFVLAPLSEIAPLLRNPRSGRTVEQELARIPHPTAVSRIGKLDRRATVLL